MYYHLARANPVVALDFLDARGAVIQSYTSNPDSATLADSLRGVQRRTARRDSLTRAGLTPDSIEKLLAVAPAQPGAGDSGRR